MHTSRVCPHGLEVGFQYTLTWRYFHNGSIFKKPRTVGWWSWSGYCGYRRTYTSRKHCIKTLQSRSPRRKDKTQYCRHSKDHMVCLLYTSDAADEEDSV